MWFIVFSR